VSSPAHHPAEDARPNPGQRNPTKGGTMRITKTRRRSTALAALGLAVAAGATMLGPGGARASSHREAPLIAADPAVDNTDVYAFVSKDRPGYVNLIANFIPF